MNTDAEQRLDQHILRSARAQALEELVREDFARLVEEEKARIRASRNKSLWQRLIQKLPFINRRKQ